MDEEIPVIRPAEKSDGEAIVALYAEMDRTHRERHPELVNPTTAIVRDAGFVEELLSQPHSAVLVAETSDAGVRRVSGLVRVIEVTTPEGRPLASRRFALVDDLVVAVDARRRGLASLLLSAVEEWARARGLPAMEATVWAFNEPMLELCEKRGAAVLRYYVRKPLEP